MSNLYKWQQKIIDYYNNLSTEKLLRETLNLCLQLSDPSEFGISNVDRFNWEVHHAIKLLYERLGFKYSEG